MEEVRYGGDCPHWAVVPLKKKRKRFTSGVPCFGFVKAKAISTASYWRIECFSFNGIKVLEK